MTIVEKWRLMLSSFADIKAAIVEMGGSVTGGFANYAKGVRSIYSSNAYTPQYSYPEELSDKLAFCNNVKEEIRQAIVGGDVECGEAVPLSEYGDKIRQLNKFELAKTRYTITCFTPCSVPLEVSGGVPPYTFSAANLGSGLTVSSDGIIAGTPTRSSTMFQWITCTDSAGRKIRTKITVTIKPKPVKFECVGSTTFKYDGLPHTLDIVCPEVPDIEFEVTYGGYTQTSVVEKAIYSVNIKVTTPGYTADKDSVNRLWITITS